MDETYAPGTKVEVYDPTRRLLKQPVVGILEEVASQFYLITPEGQEIPNHHPQNFFRLRKPTRL